MIVQAPAVQAQLARLPVQARPHTPQLARSLCVSVQAPAQQDWPMPQALPQTPQWAASDVTSTQTLAQHFLPMQSPSTLQPIRHWNSPFTCLQNSPIPQLSL